MQSANTSNFHLHIICFDVPYPVNYGGVFDVFYKIKALWEEGIKIHLHSFEYGRGKQQDLEKYCFKTYYYTRKIGLMGLHPLLPYIVSSRINTQLEKNISADNFPILMEGIHCTYLLKKGKLQNRRCFVRLHNAEHLYYKQLAKSSSSLLKKIYFLWESKMLKNYETELADKAAFWTISEKDKAYFSKTMGYKQIQYLPFFIPNYQPVFAESRGNYCLYHGNLEVPENEAAAVWLVKNVFKQLELSLVIAGKNASKQLQKFAEKYSNIKLINNPIDAQLHELIKNAQVNVLPSLNNTGVKMKLLNALYNGGHCVANTSCVDGSGLENCCIIADTPEQMINSIQYIFYQEFTEFAYNKRISILQTIYSNKLNAEQIIKTMFA